jgi:Curli production assembly/transport component CsgG
VVAVVIRQTGFQATRTAPAAVVQTAPPVTARSEDRLRAAAPPKPAALPAAKPANAPAPAPPPASKIKLAVLDFDSGRPPPKEADVGKTASDLLGKKLDSSGYTIIDRKQVDKALQEQNLNTRRLDPSTAASVGRSLGADAVILGSVKPVAASFSGAVSSLRSAPQARTPERRELEVSATAINAQTAGSVAVAQSGQARDANLADAVDQVASSLGQQIQQNVRTKVAGAVTYVTSAFLTLNMGAKAGVKQGDRFEVRRDGKPIGHVIIVSVKDTFSSGAFQGEGAAKIGDSINWPADERR